MIAFAVPLALLAAAAWLAAGWWSARREAAGRAAAVARLGDAAVLGAVGDLPGTRAARRAAFLRVAAVACALAAAARPQAGANRAASAQAARDVLVALDLSRSMLVTDADGSRLLRAREIARELSAQLAGDRLGLVIFGGGAFVQLPLTTDHNIFEQFLAAAEPGQLDDPSTDVAAPLEAAITLFGHEGGDGHRAVVLLTDGEDGAERLDDITARLQAAAVPVFGIGVGTTAGGFVPADTTIERERNEPWHLDGIGRPVSSKLEEGALRQLAAVTGGAYARWDDAPARAALLERLRAISARPIGDVSRQTLEEQARWPLLAALLLLAAEFGLLRAPRRAAAAALLLLLVAGCGGGAVAAWRAARAYANEDYAAAERGWKSALGERDDPRWHLGAGSAAYRQEHFPDAISAFRLATAAQDTALRLAAYYNLGTALVRNAELQSDGSDDLDKAITAFEQALRLAPGDSSAKWNLELALKRRGEDLSAGSPGLGGRAQAGASDGGSEENLDSQDESAVAAMAGGGAGDASGESAEEISEDQARRLLDALQREQLQNHEGRRGRRGQRHERDW